MLTAEQGKPAGIRETPLLTLRGAREGVLEDMGNIHQPSPLQAKLSLPLLTDGGPTGLLPLSMVTLALLAYLPFKPPMCAAIAMTQ